MLLGHGNVQEPFNRNDSWDHISISRHFLKLGPELSLLWMLARKQIDRLCWAIIFQKFFRLRSASRQSAKFLELFWVTSAPLALRPVLAVIELISYFVRPVSLSVRLAANMFAGHTMLAVFGGFVIAMGVFGIAPLIFIVAIYGLEAIVAFLQAYVFAVLTCLYISDALHMHQH